MDVEKLYNNILHHNWDSEGTSEKELIPILLKTLDKIVNEWNKTSIDDEDLYYLGKYTAWSGYAGLDKYIVDWVDIKNQIKIMVGFSFLEGYWNYNVILNDDVALKAVKIIKHADARNSLRYLIVVRAISSVTGFSWRFLRRKTQVKLVELLTRGLIKLYNSNINKDYLWSPFSTLENLPLFKEENKNG